MNNYKLKYMQSVSQAIIWLFFLNVNLKMMFTFSNANDTSWLKKNKGNAGRSVEQ